MGRTWGSIQNEILGLMFSNNTGGTKISPNDSSNKEYTINMADAFNCGVRNIFSYVAPCRRYCDIEVLEDKDLKEYNLEELCTDNFLAVIPDEVYCYKKTDEEAYSQVPTLTEDYEIYSGNVFIPLKKGVKFRIYYKSAGVKVTEDTPSEQIIDIGDVVIDAAVYFAASRLYMEDDVSIATQYLNMFEQMKSAIASLEKSYSPGSTQGAFINTRGWL